MSLVLIPIVLGISYYGKIPLFIFILAVQIFAGYEFLSLMRIKKIRTYPIAFFSGFILIFSASVFIPHIALSFYIFFWMLLLTIVMVTEGKTEDSLITFATGIWVMIYTFLPAWFWFFLQQEFGFFYLLLVYVGTWVPDSAAYFIGSAFGKHKISPLISPKKSMEGLLGGIITTIIIMVLFFLWGKNYLELTHHPLVFIFYGLVVSVVGFYGDLFESMLKRDAAIKDSSHLIPGHGGVLDRLDSFYFTIIFSYFFFKWCL